MKVSELIEKLLKFEGSECVIIQSSNEWKEDIVVENHIDTISGEHECLIVCDD